MKPVALLPLLLACGGSAPVQDDAGTDAQSLDVAAEATTDATIDAPDIDSIPWSTGASIGYGVAFKDTQNPLGDAMFIGYGGYGAKLIPTQLWVTALYRAALQKRGVRWIWAVQGPSDPDYTQGEIGNSKIAAALHLSLRTVESHRSNIMGKLALNSRVELVHYAMEHGLLEEGGSLAP